MQLTIPLQDEAAKGDEHVMGIAVLDTRSLPGAGVAARILPGYLSPTSRGLENSPLHIKIRTVIQA